MKNKVKISILGIITIILSISVGIMAFNNQSTVMGKMEKFSEIEVIEDISESNIQNQRSITSNNIERQESVKNYMKENKLIENDESDYKIQLVTNNCTKEKYYRMTGSGGRIDIIQDTGELRNYINSKPTNYISGTTYSREKIEQVANKIMDTNELMKANQNYELVEIKEKTTYYPTVWFKDSVNNKLMFIIFNPDSEEIILIDTKSIPVSENNEIKIDEETAKNIAKNQVNKTEDDILSVEQTEVIPNQMFLEPGYYYSEMNIKRNAYVITFNTVSKLQVYVDATTGEVIGGNGLC